ncbi:M28 family peptidase [Blastopirellula marina]|nr:M28 family peptidase [Blastopirellula marina]
MRKFDGATLFLAAMIAVAIAVVGFMVVSQYQNAQRPAALTVAVEKLEDYAPFDGSLAMGYLEGMCAIGPRVSGSPGMARQQQYLTKILEAAGGKVSLQEFDVRHPEDGSRVPMANLIAQFYPDRPERILLCAHYDTRPFPDQDPLNPQGTFVGANDGASGVAVLCELARHLGDLKSHVGVDIVFFDGEELVFDNRRDPYFLGSEYFARDYAQNPPAHRYRYGVLLDMVGDKDLQIFEEKNSLRYPDVRPLVRDIWSTARKLGIREFIARPRHEVRDDHLVLNDIAKIPTCDIIDFDYPNPGYGPKYWHTEKDVPANCSALSLAKVGKTILTWLNELEPSR